MKSCILISGPVFVGLTLASAAFAEESIFSIPYEAFRELQSGNVYSLTSGESVKNARSVLKRSDDMVCTKIDTHDLPGGAYTAWWLIYNNPEFCSNPLPFVTSQCSEQDLGNMDVQATAMWSAAEVVGPDGIAHISSCIEPEELTHAVLPVGTQEGLLDIDKAEIHVIIRNHGPGEYANAQLFGEQLNSFDGGCATDMQDGFDCSNAQITVNVGK